MIVKVSLPPAVVAKLDKRAEGLRRSRSSLIRQYVEAYIRDGREEPDSDEQESTE